MIRCTTALSTRSILSSLPVDSLVRIGFTAPPGETFLTVKKEFTPSLTTREEIDDWSAGTQQRSDITP